MTIEFFLISEEEKKMIDEDDSKKEELNKRLEEYEEFFWRNVKYQMREQELRRFLEGYKSSQGKKV